jgi:hypothetical protein
VVFQLQAIALCTLMEKAIAFQQESSAVAKLPVLKDIVPLWYTATHIGIALGRFKNDEINILKIAL